MGDQSAIKIQGCSGRYKLINGTYERMQTEHNGKPAWIIRDATPCYLFHTGKARWVTSKRMDDGQRCYAFVKDDPPGNDPSTCKGPWQTCGDDSTWSPDTGISVSKVPGSKDKFVKLRMALDDDMKKLGITGDTNNLKQLWRRLDFNGNGVVSLAEFDKMVVDMTTSGAWPQWLNNKPALMRAFQKAKGGVDGKWADYVEKCEFHCLLLNMFWFNKLYEVFEHMDSDNDRRVDLQEFIKGMECLGLSLNQAEAKAEFDKIDTNHGGEVLFVEFCAYIRTRVNPDHNPAFDSDIVSGEKAGTTLRKKHGNTITHNHFVQKKNVAMFDDLEKKIKDMLKDQTEIRKMWDSIDFNGNGKVSLAEIDKFAVDSYPLLNHKPALMRAYKKTLKDGEEKYHMQGDNSFVEKKEFKMLIGNLFYFNKLFWLFDSVDEDKDRRMTFDEFKKCMTLAGSKVSEAIAQREFKKIDKNGGGIILFDEFCSYFVQKECPEAMQQWIDNA